MNKLSKDKRDKLIGIAVGAVALMAILYFLVADAQQNQQAQIQRKTKELYGKISQANDVLKTESAVRENLETLKVELTKRESGLADGKDAYSWMLETINPFILKRKNVNLPGVSPSGSVADPLVSRSPYKVAMFKMRGTALYPEFGKFIADFENNYPYFRIQNMELAPGGGTGNDAEKLNVTFDIVTPIRPTPEPAK